MSGGRGEDKDGAPTVCGAPWPEEPSVVGVMRRQG
jgi:hypothetical protein